MDLFGEEQSPAEPESPLITTPSEPEDTLKPPREMSLCLGHEKIEDKLLELFKSGRMPHGLIFTGQKGIGKATMAYRLARFLLDNKGERGKGERGQDALFAKESTNPENLYISPQNTTFRRVCSGGHADFMSIEREYDAAKNRYKSSVPVDAIRKVPGFLRMTASGGGWRVVIIDDADTMNRNAQNALLKVLEEPPAKTVLILVTHRLGALIPTIRSRAQLMNFQPLSENLLQELIAKSDYPLSPDDVATLSELSEGSIGKAMEYMQEAGLETLAQILDLMQYHPYWDWSKLHAIADGLARAGQDESYNSFTNLLCWLFSKLCVAKARGTAPRYLQSFVENSSLEQLLKICENLNSHFAKVKFANLDKRQGILGAFSIIADQ